MKKFLITLMLAISSLTLMIGDADAARRLGGGGSIGRQSSNVTRQAAPAQVPHSPMATPNQARPATPAPVTPPPARPASPWRNILGGALLGLGLGALFSHLGIGGAMAGLFSTILTVALLAVAIMFIVRMFRRNKEEEAPVATAYTGGGNGSYPGAYDDGARRTPEIGSRLNSPAVAAPVAFGADSPVATGADAGTWTLPGELDVPSFLLNAKTYFIRLQAAWDKADVNDIREFTTPEMFAELRMQLQERGASPNHTDVVSLDAELLGVEVINQQYLASVKFSGLIKEAENAPAEAFNEVWNLSKPQSGPGGWVLAGIQQLANTR